MSQEDAAASCALEPALLRQHYATTFSTSRTFSSESVS
jgi:hypothetical protein